MSLGVLLFHMQSVQCDIFLRTYRVPSKPAALVYAIPLQFDGEVTTVEIPVFANLRWKFPKTYNINNRPQSLCQVWLLLKYPVSQKTGHLILAHNFGKCFTDYHNSFTFRFHHTLTASLHYPARL